MASILLLIRVITLEGAHMKTLIYFTFFIILSIGIHYMGAPSLPSSSDFIRNKRTPASSRVPAKASICKYVANDLKKPIFGFGATLHKARADASSKCFDVRMHAADTRSSSESDFYDRGLINIDECVNIRCS